MNTEQKLQWLPTSVKEMKERGWESADVILFSGDAYVDHLFRCCRYRQDYWNHWG